MRRPLLSHSVVALFVVLSLIGPGVATLFAQTIFAHPEDFSPRSLQLRSGRMHISCLGKAELLTIAVKPFAWVLPPLRTISAKTKVKKIFVSPAWRWPPAPTGPLITCEDPSAVARLPKASTYELEALDARTLRLALRDFAIDMRTTSRRNYAFFFSESELVLKLEMAKQFCLAQQVTEADRLYQETWKLAPGVYFKKNLYSNRISIPFNQLRLYCPSDALSL